MKYVVLQEFIIYFRGSGERRSPSRQSI